MNDDPIQFDMIRSVDDVPSAWVAAAEPYTFVITQNDRGLFSASAMDSLNLDAGRINLGFDYATLGAAQDACRDFIRSKRQ
jgi:hypothetical protein